MSTVKCIIYIHMQHILAPLLCSTCLVSSESGDSRISTDQSCLTDMHIVHEWYCQFPLLEIHVLVAQLVVSEYVDQRIMILQSHTDLSIIPAAVRLTQAIFGTQQWYVPIQKSVLACKGTTLSFCYSKLYHTSILVATLLQDFVQSTKVADGYAQYIWSTSLMALLYKFLFV